MTNPITHWTVVIIALCLAITAQAQEIPRGVMGCGGERLSGDNNILLGTLGQAVTGMMSDATTIHQAGYWYLPGTIFTAAYLAAFAVERTGSRVVVRWEVTSAPPDASFHVWREEPGQARIRISQQPLAGSGYFEFVDPEAPAGQVDYWLQEATEDGVWFGPARLSALPLIFNLEPNHPNPFNPQTSLRYSLPQPAAVRLVIYDVRGRLVRTLVTGNQPAGLHTVVWDGRDDRGSDVASGVYFARLESSLGLQTHKMLLAR